MITERVKHNLLEIAPNIFKGRKIIFAFLYGSVAVDQFHRFSDLDIAVYTQQLSPEESRKLELDLSLEIDDRLDDAPESDVRVMNALPLSITGKIVTEGILIYCEDEEQRVEYETNTRMAYFDFFPQIISYQQTYLKQLRA